MIDPTEIVGVAVDNLVDDTETSFQEVFLVESNLIPSVFTRSSQDTLYDASGASIFDILENPVEPLPSLLRREPEYPDSRTDG